jgi:surfactin synthase thioesterase subunit
MNATTLLAPPRWTIRGTPHPNAPKLYTFPHGGGSAAEYLRLTRDVPGVEVHAIQLPGRGTRIGEDALTRMDDLVERLVDDLDFGHEPFAFFGHCFGAILAYETTRELRRRGRRLPDRLVVSGYPAAHIPRLEQTMLGYDDHQLLTEVGRRYGWEPDTTLDNPEIVALAAASLRADFAVLENYRWQPEAPLPMPITVFGGRADTITKEALTAWDQHTTHHTTLRMMPGGHFYFREPRTPLPRFLTGAIRGTAGLHHAA